MRTVALFKQAAAVTSTATITLGAAIEKYRTLAQVIAAGDLAVNDAGLSMCTRNPATGAFEFSTFKVVGTSAAPQLQRESVVESSNADAAVDFGGATIEVYSALPPSYLNGQDVSALATIAPGDTHKLLVIDPATGLAYTATVAALRALFGGSAPVDNPPTLSALSASATGPNSATGSVSTNEVGGTIFWLYSTITPATETQVKAGNSMSVTAAGAQTLPGSGLTASTAYYLHVLHRDSANQDSAVLSLSAPFTTQAAGTPAPTVTGVTVSPSSVNLAGGATQQMTATVAGTNSPSQAVNWTIAPAGTVSSSGLVTAPAATSSAQTLTVTATSQQDPTKSGTATIAVAAAAVDPNAIQYPRIVDPNGSNMTETGPAPYDYSTNYLGTPSGLFDLGFKDGQDGYIQWDMPGNLTNTSAYGLTNAKVASASAMRCALEQAYIAGNALQVWDNNVASGKLATRNTADKGRIVKRGTSYDFCLSTDGGNTWLVLKTVDNVVGSYKIQIIGECGSNFTSKGLG
jgi:hypothetical protein